MQYLWFLASSAHKEGEMLSEELKIWGYHASISEKGKEQHLEMADEAAKLERVARAAKEMAKNLPNADVSAFYYWPKGYSEFCEALADLPEGALGG